MVFFSIGFGLHMVFLIWFYIWFYIGFYIGYYIGIYNTDTPGLDVHPLHRSNCLSTSEYS